MPYRINPKNSKEVQVKKDDKWQTLKTHLSEDQAKRHYRALVLNVEEKEK
jgi:hypothetical protein